MHEHTVQREVAAVASAEPASYPSGTAPETLPQAIPTAPAEETEASTAQSEPIASVVEESGSAVPTVAGNEEKSKKKAGLIVALVVALVVIAAVAGFFIWKSHSTNQTAGKSSPQNLTKSSDFPLKESTEFYFSNNNGNWGTNLTVSPDGSFKGRSFETKYEETGPGYDMTVHESNFSGKLTDWQKISDYEYKLSVEEVKTEGTAGKEEISNGTRTVVAESSPFANTKEFRLYLPGMNTQDLPAAALEWAKSFGPFAGEDQIPDTLPIAALYEMPGKQFFFQADPNQEEATTGSTQSQAEPSNTSQGESDQQALEARSDAEYHGENADDYFSPDGFWGIWTKAAKEKSGVTGDYYKVYDALFDKGYTAGIITTSKWSNLNPVQWYVVCVGPFNSQSEANKALADVKAAGYSDAYVKFSGAKK